MSDILNHLVTNYFPSSTLYEEEVDLLVSVAERFVEKYPESARMELRGSFKLIGRHRGSGNTAKIMSFDFPGGTNVGHPDHNSCELANIAIEKAIDSEESLRIRSNPRNQFTDSLVVQTKYGYFILGIAMVPRDLGHSFLLQMAVALKSLGYSISSDRRLMFSIDALHIDSPDDRRELWTLESAIKGDYFSAPAMQVWQHWHRSHSRIKGQELGFFFEEYEKKTQFVAESTIEDRYSGLRERQQNKLRAKILA